MAAAIDLAGMRFGRLSVIGRAENNESGQARWNCLCDCGNTACVIGKHLRNGHTVSCGCARQQGLADWHDSMGHSSESSAYAGLIRRYKRTAAKYGREFSLTDEEAVALFSRECYYCGDEPSRLSKEQPSQKSRVLYNGIDRVDNDGGYTADNTVSCCFVCNERKRADTQEEFISWVLRIAERHG